MKILANCEQGLSAEEQAQARENIGAQGALTAGNNITISDGVISATDTTYSAGTNVSISDQNVISATDTTYGVFNTTTDGLVPKANGTGDTDKYLKGDGTWATPPAGPTYTFSGGLTESSGTVTVDNPMPAPTFGTNDHAFLRATDNPMVGEPDTVEWVQPFHVLGWDSGTTWEEVDLMSLNVQDTPQGDWGIQATGDGISMSGLRYLVPATSSNAFLCTDANGKMEWRGNPITQTGDATHPVFVNSSNEIEQCDRSAFEGTRHDLVMASSVTLNGTSNEQDWALGPQRSWPYGWSSYRFEWNGIVTSSENITVRFYERCFTYNGLDGSFTPDAEKLLATAYLRSGTGSVNVAFSTEGWPNRKWLSSLRVTVQPDSAASGTVTLTEQAGSYTSVNSGAEIITTPNAQPSGPWTPPSP